MTRPDDDGTPKSYLVSEFIPSTPAERAHWYDRLSTSNRAEAEALCASLKGRGRIETFNKKPSAKKK